MQQQQLFITMKNQGKLIIYININSMYCMSDERTKMIPLQQGDPGGGCCTFPCSETLRSWCKIQSLKAVRPLKP